MKRPATITVPLTDAQFEALAGHFLWLDEANQASGKLGGILAQVYPDGMRVMALDHERAARLFAALGLPVPSDGARTAAEADEQIAKRREVRLVTTRVAHKCYSTDGKLHEISAGTRARLESAIVDGKWGRYYICLACIDKWLDNEAAAMGESPR